MFRPSPRRQYPVSVPTAPKHTRPIPETVRRFVPYWDPESYIRDLKTNGHDTAELERLHQENPPPVEVDFCTKKQFNINQAPIEKLYAKYKAKRPPLDERIKALHEAGYPDAVLIDVMKKDARRVADSAKLDEFIFTIFGDIADKKTPSAKKKTIHQILKIKKRVYAMPEPSDEENPVEDDLCEGDVDCDM
jgi:hypothetical protein